MSLIHTCELNNANPFDYLTELQKHSEELKQKSSEWMPQRFGRYVAAIEDHQVEHVVDERRAGRSEILDDNNIVWTRGEHCSRPVSCQR